jgi:hypothetical protein
MFGRKPVSDDQLADVFVCTMKGRGKTLFRMSVGDAKKLCHDERTKGIHFKDEWALFYDDMELVDDDEFMKDDGRFLKIIDELGLTVLKSVK